MSGRENRRVVRLRLEIPLKVEISSLGAAVKYDLRTRDISPTGFFLDFEKPGRFPFTPASIMEIWLELEPNNRIFFNGKMVRRVMPEDPGANNTGPGIAVRIVQIDMQNERTLREFIDRRVQDADYMENGDPILKASSS
jgi:hypothetical protein